MQIHMVEQRSEEWFILKGGKVSGSSVDNIYKSTKAKFIDSIVADRLTGRVEMNSFVNDAIQRGIDFEDFAKDEFSDKYNLKVTDVGFVEYNDYVGISPDGIVFHNGVPLYGVEIKCPNTKELVGVFRTNKVPVSHLRQCLLQLYCMPTMEKVYYIVYDNRLEIYPMHVIEVKREEYTEELQEMDDKINTFIKAVIKLEESITNPF